MRGRSKPARPAGASARRNTTSCLEPGTSGNLDRIVMVVDEHGVRHVVVIEEKGVGSELGKRAVYAGKRAFHVRRGN